MDRRLSRLERLAIRFHLLYCGACRRYRRQVEFLRVAARHFIWRLEGGQVTQPLRLSDDARRRIARALARGG